MSKVGGLGLGVGLVFGIYFIAKGLKLFAVPAFLASIGNWIYIALAILLILGGIYMRKASRMSSFASMSKVGFVLMAVCFLFALYFANAALNIIPFITGALLVYANGIDIVGGILLIIGGFYFWREKRY